MKFAIQVNANPWSSWGARTAYQFSRAVLAGGDEIIRIFFYQDGVFHAVRIHDMSPAMPDWCALAREADVELVLCVSAVQRRGLLGASGRDMGILMPEFKLGGLGLWVDACMRADRHMVFA
ncbi:MAG: intracellular sulfur oxidation protein DsrE [Pseudomonadota bacterium]|jgi:tRNA 2-thiouridine synthesizing protein D